MVKATVLYPAGEGKTFNEDYYRNTHRPLCVETFGAALVRMEIEKGLSGPFPGSPAPYVFTAHFYFQNLETLMGALTSGAPRLLEDIPNFTNISPIVQIGEIVG